MVVQPYLPREYLRWQPVYGYFRSWRIAGVWEQIDVS